MSAIVTSLNELHSNQICLRTMQPNTIVIIGETAPHYRVAFSELRNHGKVNSGRFVETGCRCNCLDI